jgi:hypothetical protein
MPSFDERLEKDSLILASPIFLDEKGLNIDPINKNKSYLNVSSFGGGDLSIL